MFDLNFNKYNKFCNIFLWLSFHACLKKQKLRANVILFLKYCTKKTLTDLRLFHPDISVLNIYIYCNRRKPKMWTMWTTLITSLSIYSVHYESTIGSTVHSIPLNSLEYCVFRHHDKNHPSHESGIGATVEP